jgi:AcrR family transcriptional regulator
MANGSGRDTRERLLACAEELFATRGIDAVSVRDITEAAGANTAAINYHFGSKRGLIEAIVASRADALGRRRAELLDELEFEYGDEQPPLRAVVRAMVLSTAELAVGDPSGRYYVAFLAALGDHPELMPVLDAFEPSTELYLRALALATPELPHAVRVLRFAVAKDVVNRVLGRVDGPVPMWVQRHGVTIAPDDAVDSIVDMLVGLFGALVSVPAATSTVTR